jgi:hypothetical protein
MSDVPQEPYVSQFELHEDDTSWQNRGDDLYESMLDTLMEDFPEIFAGMGEEAQEARELLYEGWFDGEISSQERTFARIFLEEEYGFDLDDFDWESWRDWYES